MRALVALALAALAAGTLVNSPPPAVIWNSSIEDTIPPAVIAEGKAIFEGKRGALCVTCHGKNAKGVAGLGPNLTDATWLNVDGSRQALEAVIRDGVLKPKQSASIMPPMGGAALKADEVRAVAAYVYTLSTKGK